MRKFSQDMIKKSMTKGDGGDIMSVLLQANVSEDPKTRLTNEEVRDQIRYATCTSVVTTAEQPDDTSFAAPFSSLDMIQLRTA